MRSWHRVVRVAAGSGARRLDLWLLAEPCRASPSSDWIELVTRFM